MCQGFIYNFKRNIKELQVVVIEGIALVFKCRIVIFVGKEPLLYSLSLFPRMGSLGKLFILRLRLNYHQGSGTVSFYQYNYFVVDFFKTMYRTAFKGYLATLNRAYIVIVCILLLSASTKFIIYVNTFLTRYKVLIVKHYCTSILNN